MFKRVFKRFLRAFGAGAFASMVVVTSAVPSVWTEVPKFLSALALAGMVGGIVGVVMAGDKLWRDKKQTS